MERLTDDLADIIWRVNWNANGNPSLCLLICTWRRKLQVVSLNTGCNNPKKKTNFTWWPNWLQGNARTANSEPNRSMSSFIWVKSRVVVPQRDAVFRAKTTLPRYCPKKTVSPVNRNYTLDEKRMFNLGVLKYVLKQRL